MYHIVPSNSRWELVSHNPKSGVGNCTCTHERTPPNHRIIKKWGWVLTQRWAHTSGNVSDSLFAEELCVEGRQLLYTQGTYVYSVYFMKFAVSMVMV